MASTFAGRLESCCPPGQVVDHDIGLLLQVGEALVHIPTLKVCPKGGNGNVDRGPNGRHLNLDCRLAKLLDGSRTHGTSVAHKRSSLAVPVRINPIDRVFQYRGGAVVVFRRDEHKTIRSCDLTGPLLNNVVFVRRPAWHSWRQGLVEERHWEIAEVE